ncbi:hypothetical protein SLA2020_000160 [Shorea laevis]
MVLNVDLQCSKCYKKVKKLLCKFPEIRDQTYDEKANKVTIKVVCCSPEKIRDKLCCKGGGCIKSIEIKKPDEKKPSQPPKPKNPPQPPIQPPPQTQLPTTPKPKPKDEPVKLSLDLELGLHLEGRPVPPPPKIPPIPLGFCCSDCYSGRPGGPCSRGWQVQRNLCYGRPVYDSWGGYGSGCGYFSEEDQQGCLIM